MKNQYYSIYFHISKYPVKIETKLLFDLVEDICSLLDIEYSSFGYTLLHPDYDYKDIVIKYKKNEKNITQFCRLSIPTLFYGKEEFPSAPIITFELLVKGKEHLYSINFEYPANDSLFLKIKIDINKNMLNREFFLRDYVETSRIICSRGFTINSSFVHCYKNFSNSYILSGGEIGNVTINDYRIMDHAIKYRENWLNRIMDVFYMNSFRKDLISSDSLDKIIECVGKENVIIQNDIIYFVLNQTEEEYLTNRVKMTKTKKRIKEILEEERICDRDLSIIDSLLKK